jgi:hypothetical protein
VTYPDGSVARKVRSSVEPWYAERAQHVLHCRYLTEMLYARVSYRTVLTSTDAISHHSSHHVPEVATALGTLHRTIPLVSHMTILEIDRPHLYLMRPMLDHQTLPRTFRSSGFITTSTMLRERVPEGECNILVSLN